MSQNENASLIGALQKTSYLDEILTHGVKSVFREGVMYRYPGLVSMLELQGSHYEMGLQYAVLAHDELAIYLGNIERVLHWTANREGVPVDAMRGLYQEQALKILGRLPDRFVKEMEGMSAGTGLPLETIAFLCLTYDVMMSLRCTGVLMRTENGGIIHARNNDTSGFGGEALAYPYQIVKFKANGFHAVTHMDFPFFMGVETGYNDQGLTFSEETLGVVKPNPEGFSLVYLVRMIMEECGTLDELPEFFDRYPVVGAYGTVWSDRQTGKGMVAELTPWGWARTDQKTSLLWNFNHLYSPELQEQQVPGLNVSPDLDREAVAETYPQKKFYTVDDALDFIGLQVGPEGLDYSHCGSRNAICNKSATQAVAFDPEGLDFYMGVGVYYAARQNVYRFYDDFSRQPVLFRAGAVMRPAVVEIARIHNLLLDNAGYRDAYQDLTNKYKDDPQVYYQVAYYSFQSKSLAQYAAYADTAFQLAPEVGDYRLFAGLAAWQSGDARRAVELLEGLKLDGVVRKHESLRLYALQQGYKGLDDIKSQLYAHELDKFLARFGAQDYFETTWKPLLDCTKQQAQVEEAL
jgi:predicted choloylglycine hydrolase